MVYSLHLHYYKITMMVRVHWDLKNTNRIVVPGHMGMSGMWLVWIWCFFVERNNLDFYIIKICRFYFAIGIHRNSLYFLFFSVGIVRAWMSVWVFVRFLGKIQTTIENGRKKKIEKKEGFEKRKKKHKKTLERGLQSFRRTANRWKMISSLFLALYACHQPWPLSLYPCCLPSIYSAVFLLCRWRYVRNGNRSIDRIVLE